MLTIWIIAARTAGGGVSSYGTGAPSVWETGWPNDVVGASAGTRTARISFVGMAEPGASHKVYQESSGPRNLRRRYQGHHPLEWKHQGRIEKQKG